MKGNSNENAASERSWRAEGMHGSAHASMVRGDTNTAEPHQDTRLPKKQTKEEVPPSFRLLIHD